MDSLRYLFKLVHSLQYVEMSSKPLSKKCIWTTDLVFVEFLVLGII